MTEHLPLDRIPLDRLPLDRVGEPLERLQGIDWAEAVSDLGLDDVLDEVGTTFRRNRRAVVVIVLATVVATCGLVWMVRRMRQRKLPDRIDARPLAGVA